MPTVIESINKANMKSSVVPVRSGDSVRVHQKVREGAKERVQVFQGLVIKTSKRNGPLSRITVRRVANGVGVEKSFLLHSPLVVKVEVTKRSKVRRNYLAYMRELTGKAARLSGVDFDRQSVNAIAEDVIPEEVNETESDKVEPADKPVTNDASSEEISAKDITAEPQNETKV